MHGPLDFASPRTSGPPAARPFMSVHTLQPHGYVVRNMCTTRHTKETSNLVGHAIAGVCLLLLAVVHNNTSRAAPSNKASLAHHPRTAPHRQRNVSHTKSCEPPEHEVGDGDRGDVSGDPTITDIDTSPATQHAGPVPGGRPRPQCTWLDEEDEDKLLAATPSAPVHVTSYSANKAREVDSLIKCAEYVCSRRRLLPRSHWTPKAQQAQRHQEDALLRVVERVRRHVEAAVARGEHADLTQAVRCDLYRGLMQVDYMVMAERGAGFPNM